MQLEPLHQVGMHCDVCVCAYITKTNAPLPLPRTCSNRHVSTPFLSHAKPIKKKKQKQNGMIYLAAVTFLPPLLFNLNDSPRSFSLALHFIPGRPCLQLVSRDGERWWWKRRRRREAFEVRKSGSLLATQLRGWDLCRFQGSVRRPEGRQVAVCRKETPLPICRFKIKRPVSVKPERKCKVDKKWNHIFFVWCFQDVQVIHATNLRNPFCCF